MSTYEAVGSGSMDASISDYISAGLFVTREVDRPSFVSAELIPHRIVSCSGCIAPFVPDTWCIEWAQDTAEQSVKCAGEFGLNSQVLEAVTAWATAQFGDSIRWPNVIVDLATAKEAVILFLNALHDVKVLELALHRSMTGDFCNAAEPPQQKPGFAPNGRQGVLEMILENRPLTQGGEVLGFEPLLFDHSLSCSWLCNSLDTVVEQALGIRPNERGLIEKLDEARRCVEYISRDEVGAEPGLWLPWLIIDHTETTLATFD